MRQPSLPEQKKIAAFLGAVDAKIAALRARKAGLEQYKRGLMQALFSQRLRFTKPDGTAFPDWEEKRLRDLTCLITKGTTPTSVGHSFQASGVNFIKAESIDRNGGILRDKVAKISNECHAQLFRSQIKSGDILFSIAGTLGRTAIAKNEIIPANTNQALAIIRLKDSEKGPFLNLFLNSKLIKKRISQLLSVGAQPNLSLEQVGSFIVPHPHPDEQQKIADALSAMDGKIQAVADQVAQMETFKNGLLQQMFV